MQSSNPRPVFAAEAMEHPGPIDGTRRGDAEAATEAASASKVVSLFTEAGPSPEQPSQTDAGALDWPSTIAFIRDVAARVKRAHAFANEVARHSQVIIQRSIKQTEEAEQRAEAAEALAQTAVARAEKAEEAMRLSEARAALAEKQRDDARATEADARIWVKRLHTSLRDEFKDLDAGMA